MSGTRYFGVASSLMALAASALLSAPVHAQDPAPRAGVRQIISTSPILLVLGVIGAEYERKISPTTAWAISGTMYRPELFSYASVEGKLRYYPGAEALKGFSVGATTGLTRIGTRDDGNPGYQDDSGTAASLGFSLEYQWLIGARRNFAVTLGAGARRLLVFGDQVAGSSLALPTARLSIGRGF